MTGRHTPGPWEACDPGDYGDFDGQSRVISNDDMRIAVVHWSDGPMRAENDANARLIAAAPDLLDALEGLLDTFNLGSGGVVKVAQDAIAKAKGPSHDHP